MKLALVMLFTNEIAWLKLHLAQFHDTFDGIVAITDPLTSDGSLEYLESLGASVLIHPWTYDWGDFATRVCNHAERLGYDAVLRLDPDECVFPDMAYRVRELLTNEAALLCFPRHEFWGDRYHVRADVYPDYQARAFRLKRGIVVGGKKHEGIDFTAHGLSEHATDPNNRVLRVTDPLLHIYHYGWSSETAIWKAMIKYQSQAQVAMGQSPVVNFPPNQPVAWHATVPFAGPQPIDPGIVGAFAPYEK